MDIFWVGINFLALEDGLCWLKNKITVSQNCYHYNEPLCRADIYPIETCSWKWNSEADIRCLRTNIVRWDPQSCFRSYPVVTHNICHSAWRVHPKIKTATQRKAPENFKYSSWKRGLERLPLSQWIKMLRFFPWKVPIMLSVSHSINDRAEVRKTPGQQHQWCSDKAALYWVRKASYLSHAAFLVQTRSYTHWNYGSW